MAVVALVSLYDPAVPARVQWAASSNRLAGASSTAELRAHNLICNLGARKSIASLIDKLFKFPIVWQPSHATPQWVALCAHLVTRNRNRCARRERLLKQERRDHPAAVQDAIDVFICSALGGSA
jgi:hypothetical protein